MPTYNKVKGTIDRYQHSVTDTTDPNFVLDLNHPNYLLYDFETTGLDPAIDQVIEFGFGGYELTADQKYVIRVHAWYVTPDNPAFNTYEKLIAYGDIKKAEAIQTFFKKYVALSYQVNLDYKTVKLTKKQNEILSKYIADQTAFGDHQTAIAKKAFTDPDRISQNEFQALIKKLFANNIVISYNGISFDKNFIHKDNSGTYANLDMLGLANRFLKVKTQPNIYVFFDERFKNQQVQLDNLKQVTVGEYVALQNNDAHNASSDVEQLGMVSTYLLGLLQEHLIKMHEEGRFPNFDGAHIRLKNLQDNSVVGAHKEVLFQEFNR